MTVLNADRWLYSALTGDAQLVISLAGRIYVDAAPPGTQYPFAVVQNVTSNQVGNLSADRVMDDELWQVTVWCEGPSYLPLEPIADRIRQVLHKSSGTGVIGAVYEGSRRLSEREGEREFKAILSEYRLYTQ